MYLCIHKITYFKIINTMDHGGAQEIYIKISVASFSLFMKLNLTSSVKSKIILDVF